MTASVVIPAEPQLIVCCGAGASVRPSKDDENDETVAANPETVEVTAATELLGGHRVRGRHRRLGQQPRELNDQRCSAHPSLRARVARWPPRWRSR